MNSLLRRARALVRATAYDLRTQRAQRALPPGAPRVAVFPSNLPWDAASNLRAWLLAPELWRLGWRVLVVPEPLTLRQRQRLLRRERPDVILLQQTRHLLNQPHLYPDIPCVLDADDADCLDPRHADRIARAAAGAAAVVAGNRFVRAWFARHNDDTNVIWTCTPFTDEARTPPRQRAPVLVWAHATPLAYPLEARLVADVVERLAADTEFEFRLFGTTEQAANDYLAPLRSAGAVCRAVPPMPYDEYLQATAECAVGLQPVATANEFSKGKSFGKLLAYLSGQVAVVASRAVDHELFFAHGANGMLAGDDPAQWAAAVRRLLVDRDTRQSVAMRGFEDFRRRLTTDVHARLLDPILRRAIERGAAGARRGS